MGDFGHLLVSFLNQMVFYFLKLFFGEPVDLALLCFELELVVVVAKFPFAVELILLPYSQSATLFSNFGRNGNQHTCKV